MTKRALHAPAGALALLLGLAAAIPAYAQDSSPDTSQPQPGDHHAMSASRCEKLSGPEKDQCLKQVKEHAEKMQQQKGQKGYDPCAPGGPHKGPAGSEPCSPTPKDQME